MLEVVSSTEIAHETDPVVLLEYAEPVDSMKAEIFRPCEKQ
jgi:hypothetical protein